MATNSGFGKIVLTALVAGALGGAVTYGGVAHFNNQNSGTTSELTTNSAGTAKVSNVKVNLNTQSERAFNATKNAVVSVINLQKESSSSSSSGLAGLFGIGGSDSNSNSSSSGKLEAASEGSGVVYRKNGNTAYIVTNNHVISGSNSLEIILSDGSRVNAEVVGKDSVTDLAVLKVNSSKIKTVAAFGNSDNIKVAEPVLAIGSPLGSQYATSVTQGIISAKSGKLHRLIQMVKRLEMQRLFKLMLQLIQVTQVDR
ncbi:serine protease, DegP/HtrA, do-like [Lentilactobacillus kosonis]|uniref:Serine protease, DegP/HtrA, do-like n=1 Tax=Lentilactobacillus kosonis TaxID=2810561 RepID=A0A401FJC2_9LACO|nr:serine protease, DegP/HtrA, do-like [Lentilactobacillus kosonis]